MTKKDYELVASAIRNIKKDKFLSNVENEVFIKKFKKDSKEVDLSLRSIFATVLANEFLKENKSFDTIKWFDACEV